MQKLDYLLGFQNQLLLCLNVLRYVGSLKVKKWLLEKIASNCSLKCSAISVKCTVYVCRVCISIYLLGVYQLTGG